ncbi:hypothetical protein AMTRI_Chr05g70420 [Amborella trichopoda]
MQREGTFCELSLCAKAEKVNSLHNLRRFEEVYWRKISCVKWLKEGDLNTKFFHSIANACRRQNDISGLSIFGIDQDDDDGRDQAIIDHLCNAFTLEVRFNPSMDRIPLKILLVEMMASLEMVVSMEELKDAVFSLAGNKAPGLMLSNVVNRGHFSGISVSSGGPSVSHLQYVDDTLIFVEARKENIVNIGRFLNYCELAVGLKVNFSKTSLLGNNCNREWSLELATTLGCKVDSFPLTYLGQPISDRRFPSYVWDSVIQCGQFKLDLWKPKYLSLGGKVTLLRSCLANIPVY